MTQSDTQSGDASNMRPGIIFAVALAAISLIGPLSVHIFLPIIPGIRAAFGMSDAFAQLNFSISLFTMAFATLVYGTLADRLGRRPVLMAGLLLFVLGSALCASAYSDISLLIGRFVQAIGAGCGVALVRTIARDAYGAAGLTKAIAYLTMAYTAGPLLAPMIGGVLHDTAGWRSVFIFSFLCSVVIYFTTWLVIPETRASTPLRSPDDEPVKRSSVFRDYIELFSHWRFAAFVFQTGLSSAIFFTMAAAAAALMKDILDRPAADYGFWFFMFPLGYFTGNFISTRFTKSVSIETMVLAGSIIGFLAAAIQCAFLLAGVVNIATLFLPGLFTTLAQGVALPYAQTGAINIVPRLIGTASGIGVFLQSFLGGAFSQMYGLLANGTVVPMVTVTMAGSILMLVAGLLPWLFPEKRT
ncbi:MAG: MFS transporter [Hyphomicrobiales bacterium]|nr:MFS transporter [Hyphomicrobiales bacterium]